MPTADTLARLIPVCEVRAHAITLAVFAVDQRDTEDRRQDRWRVRPQLTEALPPKLHALTSGRQHGQQ